MEGTVRKIRRKILCYAGALIAALILFRTAGSERVCGTISRNLHRHGDPLLPRPSDRRY